jgi:recombinational DNA repair protein RecT
MSRYVPASAVSIRLFERFLDWDAELRERRRIVRDAEKIGKVTVEMKDAVVEAERERENARREHDAVDRETCAEIMRWHR